MLKWIARLALLVIVLIGAKVGLHHAVDAYHRDKLKKEVATQLDAVPPAQRRQRAIATYLAHFWSNAALVPGLCKEAGVDLMGYSKAFARRNGVDHGHARDAYESLGGREQGLIVSVASDETNKKAFSDVLVRIGEEVRHASTLADGCQAIQQNQDKVVDKMNFRDLYPSVWSATGLP